MGRAQAQALLELAAGSALHHSASSPQVSYLFHVDFKGADRLTLGAGARLHLLVLRLEEGPQDEAALAAVVLHHAELWQDPRAARHHPTGSDQLVQVQLPRGKREGVGYM